MENSITNNNEASIEINEEKNIIHIETKAQDEKTLSLELPKEKKPMSEKKQIAFANMQKKRIENANLRKSMKDSKSIPKDVPKQPDNSLTEESSSEEEIIHVRSTRHNNKLIKKKKKIIVLESSDEDSETDSEPEPIQSRNFLSQQTKRSKSIGKKVDYSKYFCS